MRKPHIDRMKALTAAQRRRSVLLFNDKRIGEMDNHLLPTAAHSAVTHSTAPWYRFIKSSKNSGNVLWILDDIGESFGGMTVAGFAKELNSLPAGSALEVAINSAGGDVFAGRAIANLIKGYAGPTTARILGIAASIASVIALSCQKVLMAPESFFCIHNAWTGVVGDAAKLRKIANDLDVVNETIVSTYLDRVKNGARNRDDIIGMMNNETWVSAAEALQIGWADQIEEGAQRMAASLADKGRFKNFRSIPSRLAAAHSAEQDHTLWLRRKQLDLF